MLQLAFWSNDTIELRQYLAACRGMLHAVRPAQASNFRVTFLHTHHAEVNQTVHASAAPSIVGLYFYLHSNLTLSLGIG